MRSQDGNSRQGREIKRRSEKSDGNRRQGTKWAENNHGTRLDFSRNLVHKGVSAPIPDLLYLFLHCSSYTTLNHPSQNKDPSNLLNCYPVSWKGTKFRSLYRHSHNGDGTAGQTRFQRQCDFTDNFINSSRRLQREVWKKPIILAHRMLYFQ